MPLLYENALKKDENEPTPSGSLGRHRGRLRGFNRRGSIKTMARIRGHRGEILLEESMKPFGSSANAHSLALRVPT
jgi:hypothetical protein